MSTPQPAPAEDDPDDDDGDDERTDAETEAPAESNATDDPFDGSEDAEEEIDLDLAETDIGDQPESEADAVDERLDELDAENAEVPARDDPDPFDGSENADSEWDEGFGDRTYEDTESPHGEMMDEMVDGFTAGEVSDAINEGAARLAVVGLPDEFEHNGETKQKSDLEDEFQEVFETFRLGQYGEKTAEEYLDVQGDVDPLWGFTASMLVCSVLVLQMRPDGGEIAAKAQRKINGMGSAL